MMNNVRYRMSFTTGGLFLQESLDILHIYQQTCDWDKTREQVLQENTLQVRTERSIKRISREIIARLQMLSEDEIQYVSTADLQDQKFLLWIAICRLYQFVADFAVEVIHEHVACMRTEILSEEFNAFLYKKSQWHPELEKLTDSTVNKLRSVLFRMMKEADIINDRLVIMVSVVSQELFNFIVIHDVQELKYYPIHSMQLKEVTQ